MMVRLAFAVMVQADADIMLIDEVLAVGDAAFAQKCMDVFHEKRDARARRSCSSPTTWRTVQSFCHRAMLIHDGELQYLGDPEEAALRYYRLNFAGPGAIARDPTPSATSVDRPQRAVVEATLRDEHGDRVENVEQGNADHGRRRARGRAGSSTRPSFGFQVAQRRRRGRARRSCRALERAGAAAGSGSA